MESKTLTVSQTDDQCEECGGEGFVDYARGEDCERLPCQKCYPPIKKGDVTTWEDLIDPDCDDGF